MTRARVLVFNGALVSTALSTGSRLERKPESRHERANLADAGAGGGLLEEALVLL